MSKFTDSNTSYSALEESYINLTKRPDSTRTDYQTVLVFHCGMCNTIWGDSLGVCGEEKQLNSVIFLRVSKDVVVKDELEFRLQGQMAGCAYKALHCSGCQCFVGIVPYSTPKHLSALRNLFLMQKENINCYSLGNGSMQRYRRAETGDGCP
ncbi:hypothetical protein GJAV_G00003920 [Gymnothorax javanicus]|nr:hypothetical protein GJAV_G00003920 [Gymnothorax javanicus]